MAEARQRAQVAQAEAYKATLARAWAGCGVGRRYLGASFDDWPEDDLVARQVDWHPLIEGAATGVSYFNLLLHGPCGTGKTRLAAAWLRARCIEDEQSCAFVVADALAREVVGARDRDSVLAKYAALDALVIDDLVTNAKQSQDVQARHFGALEQVIDVRNSDSRRTCFTTNATPDDMRDGQMFSARCLSRMLDQALVLEVSGPDRRRQAIGPAPTGPPRGRSKGWGGRAGNPPVPHAQKKSLL